MNAINTLIYWAAGLFTLALVVALLDFGADGRASPVAKAIFFAILALGGLALFIGRRPFA
jgi:hypothetical protein